MSVSLFNWIAAHKEWSFTALCTVSAGIFGVLKWLVPRDRHAAPHVRSGARLNTEGSQNNSAIIADGASINAPFIVGSHNVQNLVLPQMPGGAHIPIRLRGLTSPTGNEIRQKEEAALQNIPLSRLRDVQKQLWDAYQNIQIRWPIRLYGIYSLGEVTRLPTAPEDDGWVVKARYGEESWGARIHFCVKARDYPILGTVGEGHRAFVEGTIKEIDSGEIVLEVSTLEVE